MQQAHLQDLAENRYLHPPSCMRDEDFEEIEAYVDNLKTAVEEFRDSSWTAWSGAGSQISETTDALCLKADVILWRLRVAKRFAYPARQVLWEDIQASIANLEEGAESMVNNNALRARGGRKPDRNRNQAES
jgi:hypothetical protein